jgi:hypothetical protein
VAWSVAEWTTTTVEEAEQVLSELMLLRLRAWNLGEHELAEHCHRAEQDLRGWLERKRQ